MKKVMAIIGSLRAGSSNHSVIEHIKAVSEGRLEIEVYDGLRHLPQFDPDLDTEDPPEEVKVLRNTIREADGVLISTPEYVFGVPGALKNAIDWTVSSADFLDKPVALITASSAGAKAHESLLLTLRTVDAVIGEDAAVLISHVRAKLGSDRKIKHPETIAMLDRLIASFIHIMN
jgi:NAD(P)H-dependent FMN reductase